MKHLLLIFTIFCLTNQAFGAKKIVKKKQINFVKPVQSQGLSALQLPNFQQFSNLTVDQRVQVLQAIREFSKKTEGKWKTDGVAEYSPTPFEKFYQGLFPLAVADDSTRPKADAIDVTDPKTGNTHHLPFPADGKITIYDIFTGKPVVITREKRDIPPPSQPEKSLVKDNAIIYFDPVTGKEGTLPLPADADLSAPFTIKTAAGTDLSLKLTVTPPTPQADTKKDAKDSTGGETEDQTQTKTKTETKTEKKAADRTPMGGDCPLDQKLGDLNQTQNNAVRSLGEQCIKGGILVCLTLESNGRLKCSQNDDAYKKISQGPPYNCAADQRACALPLYMTADGGAVCVPGADPITDKCEAKAKELNVDPKKIAELAKDKKFADEYKKLKDAMEKYCNPKRNKWQFDIHDCQNLQARMNAIWPITKALVNGNACDVEGVVNGETLHVKLAAQGKPLQFTLDVDQSLKDKGWVTSKCDHLGRVVGGPGKADGSAQSEMWSPCLAQTQGDTTNTIHFEAKSLTDADKCQFHQTEYKQGRMDLDGPGSGCFIRPFDGYSLHANQTKGWWSKANGAKVTGAAWDLWPIPTGDGPVHYQMNDGKTFRNIFFNPNSGVAEDKCWGQALTVVDTKDSTQAGTQPASAEQGHHASDK